MQFGTYGPFEVPEIIELKIDSKQKADFWSNVDAKKNGLSAALGVYIFSIKYGDRLTPWYVGKTSNGFKSEIFQLHKLAKYDSCPNGKRQIHLIPIMTPKRQSFPKYSAYSSAQIDLLETAIIGIALRANPNVKNDKKTKWHKNCVVPGVIGKMQGRPSRAASTLRQVLKPDNIG